MLSTLSILSDDRALACESVSGNIHPPVLTTQLLQRAMLAYPIGHQLPKKGIFQGTVDNYSWEPRTLSERGIIVNLIKVTLSPCILH